MAKSYITPQAFDTNFKTVEVANNTATVSIKSGNRLRATISANTTFNLSPANLPTGQVLLLRLKISTSGATPSFSGATVNGTVITTANATNLIVFINEGETIKGFVL